MNTYVKRNVHLCVNYSLYRQFSHGVIFLPMRRNELSTAEVAERMNVSVHAVRWWCRHGLLPNAYEMSTPRGPVWMIPEVDLKNFEPPKKTGRPPKPKAEKASGSDGKVNVTSSKKRGKK